MKDLRHKCKVQESQLSVTNRATHLCKRNGVAELIKTRPCQMCYYAEFGRSALKGESIRRTRKIGERLGPALLW